MNLNNRYTALKRLGTFLRHYACQNSFSETTFRKQKEKLDPIVYASSQINAQFTEDDIYYNLQEWGKFLETGYLDKPTSEEIPSISSSPSLALLLSDPTPLSDFHNFIFGFLYRYTLYVKCPKESKPFLQFISQFLARELSTDQIIKFPKGQFPKFDIALINQNQDRTAIFEKYLSPGAHLIIPPKHTIGIITGEEDKSCLEKLGSDIFRYFGRSRYNLSKLYIPENYDFGKLFRAIEPWRSIINAHRYANNYDYNKSVYLMSDFKFLDNGFLILKEDHRLSAPMGCLFFEYYNSKSQLETLLQEVQSSIQQQLYCAPPEGKVAFGAAHKTIGVYRKEYKNNSRFLSSAQS